MPASMVQAFMHYVWGTYQRNPWLEGAVRETAYRVIAAKCQELGAQVIALNGVADHVHLLVKIPPSVTLGGLVGAVKGSSSHAITHRWPNEPFKWQNGYGAFTVSVSAVPDVRAYIANQQAHHSSDTCRAVADLDENAS